MFVVLGVEMAVTRKRRINAVLCFEAVNILDLPGPNGSPIDP